MSAVILFCTAIWHALATWHFTFYPARTLARTTRARPIEAIPTELFRFLGGLNAALVLLALLACAGQLAHGPVALVLAVANFSQYVQDLRIQKLEMAHGPMFRTILWLDGVFTVLNLGVVGLAFTASGA